MKKNISKYCIAALALGMGMTSCEEWLNLEPENSVTAENYWMTESDVANAMTGIYCQWLNCSSSIWEQCEMRDDMVTYGNVIKSDYLLVREGNITSSNSLVAWSKYYSIINNCNLLLERSEIALANDPAYSATQDKIYHAQARVIRAMMYFYLIRLWKDVPYITYAFYDDTRNRYPVVSKQMDVLNACIADLEAVDAEGDLPYSYSSATSGKAFNKGQVTRYMLKALLADMYRMKGSYATDPATSKSAYQKSLALCNTIIESGQFALVPFEKQSAAEANIEMTELTTKADSSFYPLSYTDPTDWFCQVYVDGNSNESIMELQQDNKSYNSSGFYSLLVGRRYYAPNTVMLDNSLFLPTEKELAAAYLYQDARGVMNARVNNGGYYIWKYAGKTLSNEIISAAADYKKNVLVYRLAEIYLIKAEVLTQLAMADGNNQEMLLEAYRALFKVRDRASAVETSDIQLGSGEYMQDCYWAELRGDLPISLKSGDLSAKQMEKLVLDEEAREMAFEGRRWFDVLRNAERNQEGTGSCTGGDISYLLTTSGSCTETDKVAYIMGQFRKPDFRYLPYPYQDVALNDNLKQKPFWGIE